MKWWSLLALLSLAVVITSAQEDDDNGQLQKDLVDWVRSKGGFFSKKQEIRRSNPNDSTSIFGVFATQDIKEGEVLASIPWDCILTAGTDTFSSPMMCDSIRVLIDELHKGNESDYAPYVNYIAAQPERELPSAWSDNGKDLLDLILGQDMLPPRDMMGWLDYEWREDCHGSEDAFEQNAALQFMMRADDDLLIPLYDLYNHRNGKWYNTESLIVKEEKHDILASRDITQGEELYNSYNQCKQCQNRLNNYGTPEVLRDYAFVEFMPQRWIFHKQDFGFDVDENADDNELQVYWIDGKKPKPQNVRFLQQHLHRLRNVVEPEMKRVLSTKTLPSHEAATIQRYYDSLTRAMASALQDLHVPQDSTGTCVGGEQDGVCLFDNQVYNLKTMGKKDPNVQTCDNERILKFDDYDWIEEVKSNYQTLTFMYRPDPIDMCLDLDDIVQICTCYRPHYHEYVTHFPARYKEKIQRAVFVGGGDSMVLHELLKYPDIELVLGLELDQVVVRKSFKYFHTQPHFDDDRVQWWFGDATKSLLMLPKSYFGSFDLVVVDLSETVMSHSVTKHLDILEALALLLNPDGIFVKNEWYLDKLSTIFDYTTQVYITDNPIICEQAVAIGSNRIDFLHPDVDILKKHDVEMLLLEQVKDDKDRFMHMNGYRKNDAIAQGKCDVDDDEKDEPDDGKSVGVLMIMEAENTTASLEWDALEGAISSALENQGLTPLTKISYPLPTGGTVGMILMAQGVVAVRTWPEHTYCAFDIQMWGGFNTMEGVKEALAKVVGSSKKSVSSYRIVTGGLLGTKSRHADMKTIGPVIAQNRDCEVKPISAKVGVKIDQSTCDALVEESLTILDRKDMVVAVLCGDRDAKCTAAKVLEKNKTVRKVVPIYTCPALKTAPYLEHGLTTMFGCETETLNMMRDVVDNSEKLSAFVIDESANLYMAQAVDKIFRNPRNSRRLLMPKSLFVATMLNGEDKWRRNFLGKCRRYIEFDTLNRAEVMLKSADGNSMELGLFSTGDEYFYAHLVDAAEAMKSHTGLDVEIKKIDGGPAYYQVDYKERRYKPDDYPLEPGKEQYAQQKPLAQQIVLQLEVTKGPDLSEKLEGALGRALKGANFSNPEFHVFEDLGKGDVFIAVAPEGSAVVVWDGDNRVDVNLFTFDVGTEEEFVDRFKKSLKKSKAKPKVLLLDEQPRGIGRVINFVVDVETEKVVEKSPDGVGRVVKF